MQTQAQERFIEQTLQEWAALVDGVLKERLRERVGKVPSDTLENLREQVIQTSYYLAFQDSGRIIEMRNITRRKRPVTTSDNFILEWVKKKGLGAFKFVPGEGPRSDLTQQQKESRVANAVIASMGRNVKAKNAGRAKNRRWFNKTFYGLVDQLIRDLLDKQSDFLRTQLVDPLREATSTK